MNHKTKHNWKYNYILYLFVGYLGLSFPQGLHAQVQNTLFIMSSVAGLQNMSNNSMAISFSSTSNCIHLQNGAAVLTGERGTGNFSADCEVNTQFNTLGINLFPNPVSFMTKLKIKYTIPANEQFSISIWNAEGVNVISINATGYEISHGKLMNFGTLTSGSYVLQLNSPKYQDAIKFIKAN